MATIGTRTFADGDKKYILMDDDDSINRPFTFGNSWTKIRIGILYAIRQNECINSIFTGIESTFALGVCNSASNGYGEYPCNSWIGVFAGGSMNSLYTGQTGVNDDTFRLTLTATSSYFFTPYSLSGHVSASTYKDYYPYSNILTSMLVFPAIGGTSASGSTVDRRFPLVVEIERLNITSSTISYYTIPNTTGLLTTAASNFDYTVDGLKTGMTGITNIIINGTTLAKNGPLTYTGIDFTNYNPINANIYYKNIGNPMEIYYWGVYKIS